MTIGKMVPALAELAAAAALTACGGSSSSKSSNPASARAFCESLAQVAYDKAVFCEHADIPPIYLEVIFGCLDFQDAQDAKRIAYDGSQAKACLDAMGGASCVQFAQYFGSGGPYDVFGRLPAACQSAVAPAVAAGGDCFSALGIECIGGYCDIQDVAQCFAGGATCAPYLAAGASCSTGRCAPGYHCSTTCVADTPITVLQAGGDCSVADTLCDDGLYCASNVCTARKTAGISCSGDGECLEGLACLSSVCTALKQAAAACTGGDCASGLYCNTTGICAAYPTVGQSCTTPASGDTPYCVDSWCDTTSMAPTCKAYVDPGATCAPNDMLLILTQCGPGSICYPISLDGGSFGVCGRAYCVPFG